MCVPDDLPYEEILELAMPFLGPFISRPVDWNPVKALSQDASTDYLRRVIPTDDDDETWQFESFLFAAY